MKQDSKTILEWRFLDRWDRAVGMFWRWQVLKDNPHAPYTKMSISAYKEAVRAYHKAANDLVGYPNDYAGPSKVGAGV